MNTKFYIFRHGETFATKAGTAYGWRIFRADILPEARGPLEKIGNYLKDKDIDFSVSSKFKRCRQSAGIVEEITGNKFVYDSRINEYLLEPFWYLKKRVLSLIREINERNYKSVCICTHGAVIAALIHVLTPVKTRQPFSIYNFPAPGILVVIEDGNVKEINFNTETRINE